MYSSPGYDRASRMTDKALKGFARAHTTLQAANQILADEAEQARKDREEWQKQVEQAMQDAADHEAACARIQKQNEKRMAHLSQLIDPDTGEDVE